MPGSAQGRGQVVDAAIFESVLAVTESLVPEWQVAGTRRERTGPTLPGIAPSNIYRTADGSVLIAANQDSVFRRLAEAMGRPELTADPRYCDHQAGGVNQAELDALVEEWTSALASRELLHLLVDAGVPSGLVYEPADMLADPHFQARGSLVAVPDRSFGELVMSAVVPRLSETPGEVRWSGPRLGEHTDEVLREIAGLSEPEIDELRAAGVI